MQRKLSFSFLFLANSTEQSAIRKCLSPTSDIFGFVLLSCYKQVEQDSAADILTLNWFFSSFEDKACFFMCFSITDLGMPFCEVELQLKQ